MYHNKSNDDHQSDQNPEHPYTIPQDLSKNLVQIFPPPHASSTKRVPPDTAAAMSEVLRLFVVEAHARASVEAECDNEGALDANNESGGDKNDDSGQDKPDKKNNQCWAPIRAEHITKVAANLLMDFS